MCCEINQEFHGEKKFYLEATFHFCFVFEVWIRINVLFLPSSKYPKKWNSNEEHTANVKTDHPWLWSFDYSKKENSFLGIAGV